MSSILGSKGSVLRGSLVLLLLLAMAPVTVARAAPPALVLGVATGETDEPGSLAPLGNGRFRIEDRVYIGRSLARSVDDDWADCLSGQFTATEEWTLEAPKMTGAHQSSVQIRSERALVTLRLRGQMDFPSASGSWEISRATGPCAHLEGEGRYTATFSSTSPDFRLTFEGQVRS